MKASIHPTYFEEAQILCSCGSMFVTGSTKKEIHIEVCSKCHPLYTGEKRYIDTLGQVGKFQKKQEVAKQMSDARPSKKKIEDKKGDNQPKSLKELLMDM